MLDLASTDQRAQSLRSLIRWLAPTIFVFALAYGAIGWVFQDRATIISALVIALYGGVLLAAHRYVAQGRMAFGTYLVGGGLISAVLVMTVSQPALYSNYAMVPMLVAAVLLQYAPRQHARHYLAICGTATLIIATLGTLLPTSSALPISLLGLLRVSSIAATVMFTLFMLWQFSSQLTDTLDRVQATNQRLETQNAELAIANQTITSQLDEQHRLLDLVTTLELPIIMLSDGVFLTPLMGHMDNRRTETITSRLLQTVYTDRAQCVILDMSGLTVVDTAVATRLANTIQSLRLLGCQVFVSGISTALALTMTHLKIDLKGVETIQSPQEALTRLGHTDGSNLRLKSRTAP
jgi:rsbT co-antagonist protein RsbR